MVSRNDIVRYVVENYYDGSVNAAVEATGYTREQINSWIADKKKPQEYSVGLLLHAAFAPEFKVIAEYAPIEMAGTQNTVHAQLAKIFKGHEKVSGVYAFYDSMANLIYLGKSNGNLFPECYTQIKARLKSGVFPKGAKQPQTRLDIVRYVSAYYVQGSAFEDYAKHIESLILRISKPKLNTNIGSLQQAKPKANV